ncbi:alkyl sulfatase-like protein [Tamaricihabitans halophyticus]|uniref:Alkyl sulfatase-like protein n=1 Tax=Tamaricihabitans halophyticus TaxID=1262583 RepID=A0A4R2R431_9PSEU|nr:alkyl sulfatase C-terminal domain-containing protein [Tamaricihabitans halophyticus]TCP57323.1 alkyl sulfatase-like protein [Tamaricihabitans halophyticus]
MDAFADAIDLDKLDAEQFVRLIEVLRMLGTAGTGIEIGALRTETVVSIIDRASRAQLDQLMAVPELRELMLDELFRRMAMHVNPARASAAEIVVCWRFPIGEGAYERYQTVIENGSCLTGRELDRLPAATVTLPAADLLKLATGSVSIPVMFLRGRIKVNGDIPLVTRLTSYFDIPKA